MQQIAKRRKQELDNTDAGLRAPTHYAVPWESKKPFSNLSHMCQTPMAKTVLQSLRKKGTDLKFMCNTVCGAAVQEGSRYFQTKALAGVCKEAKFHKRIARDLPVVSQISLPVQVRKKLRHQKFSSIAAVFQTHIWSRNILPAMRFLEFLVLCDVGFCSGFVRPSAWFSWLEKRPEILRRTVYGESTAAHRQLRLSFFWLQSSSIVLS